MLNFSNTYQDLCSIIYTKIFMLHSTILATLRLLNEEERQLLDYFIVSPLYKLTNRHQDAVALWQYLKPYCPLLDDETQLERTRVTAALFGRRANAEAELRKAMSNLNNIVRRLILFQSVNGTSDNPQSAHLLAIRTDVATLSFLSERLATQPRVVKKSTTKPPHKTKAAEDLIAQTYNAALAKINATTPQDIRQMTPLQYQNWMYLGYQVSTVWLEQVRLSKQDGIQPILQSLAALEQFYRHEQADLRLFAEVFQLTRQLPPQDEAALTDTLWSSTDVHPPSTALQLYQQVIGLLQQNDPNESRAALDRITAGLANPGIALPVIHLRGIKAALRIFCGVMANTHDIPYFHEKRFHLFREHIQEDMLLHHGQVSAIQLSGLISDALRLGGYVGWAADFLQQFEQGRGIIGTQTAREVYKINVANLRFHQQQYREAANELIGYEWYGRVDDPQLLLLAIRIDLKARYELSLHDDDHTIRTLDAAEKRITRLTDIAPQLSQMTLHFLRIIKQLSNIHQKRQIKHPKNFDATPKCQQLRIAIHDKPTAEKAWLQAKIAELDG